MIRGRADAFLDLLMDPDPAVRAAAPGALAQLHTDPARVFAALEALRRYGRAAAGSAPRLRESMADESAEPWVRLQAAAALRAVTGDATEALPVVREALDSGQPYHRRTAVRVAGSFGPAGAQLAPGLSELAASDASAAAPAIALWQVTRDATDVLPAPPRPLDGVPPHPPGDRPHLADMGAAASPAIPLIRQELANTRRHNNDNTTGNVRYDVASDERLPQECRRMVATLGG